MIELSKRAQKLKPSPTLFLVAKAKELSAQGHNVISLTVGEPDWETFSSAKTAGIYAIQENITKYTPANGTLELRQVICQKLKRELGIDYSAEQITVAAGAKYIIFSALQVLCSSGDEVIIGAPYWVSYPAMVELAEGNPKIVLCDEATNFKMTGPLLEQAINKKTKVFMFCSPSNPTGLQYSRQELEELAEVLRRHPQVAIISDDIYNRLVFDGSLVAPHLLQVAPDLADRAILINGGSKAYAMTGWRIGWASGPLNIIKSMADYQSQSTGSPPTIAQYALQKAIEGSEEDIQRVNERLIYRRKSGLEILETIPEFKVFMPEGAFYFWIDISAVFGKTFQGKAIENSKDFCGVLLEKFFVATVPGAEFGMEGYMRLSFACSEGNFRDGVTRMRDMISQLV